VTLSARADDEEVQAAIVEDFGGPVLEQGNIEITMPEFSDSGSSVPMELFVPAAMTREDYPREVRVYAARNPRPRVIALFFTPACGEAWFSTRVRLASFQDVVAVAEMANGDRFRSTRRVNVTYGACEQAVANNQFPPGWSPSIRISVPEQVAPGEVFDIRTIIGHPMETGLRYSLRGLLIPERIVERFVCRIGDEVAFSAELERAISANPYLAFKLRLLQSAELHFEWVDTTGEVYRESTMVEVV
jgi:thiosulfate oxidation carrier complex protein SoxZ